MAIAKVFMSGRSQAVPINANWSNFFTILKEFEDVDAIERYQPKAQQLRDCGVSEIPFLYIP
jgi:hypothetical protein